jgi:sugar phosphate permease
MSSQTIVNVLSYEDIEVEASRSHQHRQDEGATEVTWNDSLDVGGGDRDDSMSNRGQPQRKYATYHIKVDPNQDDRAAEIKLCSFARPHMRAFHFAWWSYHVAFLMWFSISPLLSEVQKTLGISKQEIWTSSITAVAGTIVMRFVLGPFCDKYGPRIPMGIILLCSAIPTGLTGLVNSATGLAVLRFFIGIGGSTFVMAQYWASTMFTKEWVGTANATVGGWYVLPFAVCCSTRK